MEKIRVNRVLLLTILVFSSLKGQIISPFNKKELNDSTSNYTFIVSGHFHGASTSTSSFPAGTLQGNIDTLNSIKPLFLMSLGDLFLDVNESYLKNYQKSLFDKLQMPLFNVVGNHDLANGNMYEKVFGKTFFSFSIGSEYFILLNTEVDDGSIKNEQLAFLEKSIEECSSQSIKNVFVFSHRPVWAENNDKYKKLFSNNTHSELGKNNFNEVVLPLISKISKTKNVYWMSGSMGGGPSAFFYDKDLETNITYIQTAIRDRVQDAVLKVDVRDGGISFNGISFTNQAIDKVENYGVDFWKNNLKVEQSFNYRLIPFYFKKNILSTSFWLGFSIATFLVFLIAIIKKRWKKRK